VNDGIDDGTPPPPGAPGGRRPLPRDADARRLIGRVLLVVGLLAMLYVIIVVSRALG